MEKIFFKQLLFALIISMFSAGTQIEVQAQCQPLSPLQIVNGSFEGTPEPHVTPAPWSTCGVTPDTQPGVWGVTLPPSEGNTYVGFVYGGTNWEEGASQQLSSPMSAGIVHEFSIDLSATPATGGGIDSSSSCAMEIWGANSICQKEELLWASPTITHYGWQTYTVTFTPSQDFEFIYFICNGGQLGYILLDNITSIQAVTPIMELTSHVDGDIEDCNFNLSGTVSSSIVDSVVVTGNFQGSPLNTTLTGLNWSGSLSMNQSGNQEIVVTAYYTDQLLQDICVYTQLDLVINGPDAGFSFNSECENVEVSFMDTSAALSPNTLTNWSWDFGDGGNSTTQNPQHIFTTSGLHQVILEVMSSDGCISTDTQSVEIYEAPFSDFTFTEVCVGYTTNFHDFSTTSIGTLTSWHWDFGDGNSSTLVDPVHSYANPGAYSTALMVENAIGCWDTLTQIVEVFLCTSINDESADKMISIYLLPASDVLNIEFSSVILSLKKEIIVYNSSGQLVYSKIVGNNRSTSIPTNSLTSGVYILEMRTNDIPPIRQKFSVH